MTTLDAHLVSAGATIDPVFKDIGRGASVPTGRCIRYWYEGDGEPVRMGAPRTLTDEMVGERVRIRAFWPLPSAAKTYTSAIDVEAQALKAAIKSRLVGDSQLGGQCVDLDVGSAEVDFVDIAGTAYMTLDLPLTLDLVDVDTIAA